MIKPIDPRLDSHLRLDPEDLSKVGELNVTHLNDYRKGNIGTYTTDQAPGAIPNGTIVEKLKADPGDAHPDGSRARILGSIGPAEVPGVGNMYGYFVEWEDTPGVPVFIGGPRIRRVEP